MSFSHTLTCQYEPCGKTFEAARRRKYCEPLCANRAYSKAKVADGRAAQSRRKRAGKIAAYRSENVGRWKVERECHTCRRKWLTHRKDAKYCSPECKGDGYRGQPKPAPSRQVLARRRLQRAARGVRGLGVWADAACVRCDSRYVVKVRGGRPAAHCSRACHDGTKGALRRAREREVERETVYRARVFQRDDWCCHLCGEDIDRDVVAPAPLAPTLDHVVPIARGGAHTMINLRAAHFRCNSAKGSRLTWAPAA